MKDQLTPEMEQPEVVEEEQNLAGKTLAELSGIFSDLMQSADSMVRSKEAESIKSAFYKLLNKMKAEAGEAADSVSDALVQVENNFKELYSEYKKERAEFNAAQEAQRESNLAAKKAVVEELKALVESQDEPTFQLLRDLQNRWREIGPVPATAFRDLNDTYQFYVEKFYDRIQINRDLRDLDFKKNLEAKTAFCEAAEKLAENENIVDAFAELQKLHEQWKEFGPVAKEFREDIWSRFKAATSVINKKYQEHFEEIKARQVENLAAKTALCEKIEALVAGEFKTSSEWNSVSREIEKLQAEWRKIGFATRKENQKIYDRFRASCDSFFARKKEFYAGVKSVMEENVRRKEEIISRAEALKTSTEWKKTSEILISLQKQWKEIGEVPFKKSEELWKRFRAACDAFFDEREKNAAPENNYYANLKAKKALIEEVNAYQGSDDKAMEDFSARWSAIGFVPIREKENIGKAFNEAMRAKFPSFGRNSGSRRPARPLSPRDELVRKFNALQQEIATCENNIGFFSVSKGSSALLQQMNDRIAAAKEELKRIESEIRKAQEEEN